MDRSQFVQLQADWLDAFFSLAQKEGSERRHFEQLAVDTYVAMAAEGIRLVTAFTPPDRSLNHWPPEWRNLVPPSILERWKDWAVRYRELLNRSSRLELREMMHLIGETSASAAWPYYLEEAIQDWIDGCDFGTMPFLDHKGIVTPEFYGRLRELRARVGGWMYWRDTKSGVVFLREEQWQRLRSESKSRGYLDGRRRRLTRTAK